jgi:hypothetical protein
MFKTKSEPDTSLDAAMRKCFEKMKNLEETSDEYGKVLSRLSELHEMKQAEKPDQVSKNTMVLAATNLIGIFLIINHEHLHPVTTRAMSLAQAVR